MWLQHHGPFTVILAIYILTAAWLAFRIPAFAMPNEQLHYEHVALILRTGWLPDPSTSTRMDERHQPPLYYSLAALAGLAFSSPSLDTDFPGNPYYLATHEGNRNGVIHATPQTAPVLYTGRLLSMFFGVLCLISMYAVACRYLTRDIGVLMVSLTAFQPMFLFLSASLNNDLAVTAMSALLIAYTSIVVKEKGTVKSGFVWGFLCSLAVLTKANALLLLGLLPLVSVVVWRRRGPVSALSWGLAGAAGFLPLYSVWVTINIQRHVDPTGTAASIAVDRLLHTLTPANLALLRPYLSTLWQSFWLDWSPGGIGYAPSWVYVISGIALLLAGAGWLAGRSDLRYPAPLPWIHALWAIPLCVSFLAAKALMVKETNVLVAEGRWALPIVPSLAWGVAVGWARLWPQRWRGRACALAAPLPIVGTLLLLLALMTHLYPPGAQLTGSIPKDVQPLGFSYDGEVELVGAQIDPLVVDKPAVARLIWRASKNIVTDYSYALLLLVPGRGEWQRLDGQHSYPGAGLTPTKGWQRGDSYADWSVLIPRGDLNGPVQGVLEVQLFDGQTALPVTENGQTVDTAIALEVVVRPAAMPVIPEHNRPATPVTFGGVIALAGASATPTQAGLTITLWWQPLSILDKDFSIFVHVLDEQGQSLAQVDSMPDADRSPTHIWQAGDTIRDRHILTSYPSHGTVLIGVYDSASMVRLNALQGGQALPDNAFRLTLPQ